MLNSAHFKVTDDEFNKFEFGRAKDQEGSPLDQI